MPVQYEDQLLQALALSVMPMERLTKTAEDAAKLSKSLGEQPARAAEDSLAQELLNWFKHDFFTWVSLCSVLQPPILSSQPTLVCSRSSLLLVHRRASAAEDLADGICAAEDLADGAFAVENLVDGACACTDMHHKQARVLHLDTCYTPSTCCLHLRSHD